MKKLSLCFMLGLVCLLAHAQTAMIKQIFRQLPAYMVYDLSVATRDSLLQGKTYYPADNDTSEIMAYNYGISENVKDYIYVSLSYETGQRASGLIEIRSFKMQNAVNLILVSQTSGVPWVVYDQGDFSAFTYGKEKRLIPYKKKILPEADEKIFMKSGIPDSVKQMILGHTNVTYDLSGEKLTLGLKSEYISGNKTTRQWLKGDLIYFDWINDHFAISKIEFEFSPDEP